MSSKRIITMHALLRYLERVEKRDVAAWREGVRRMGGNPQADGEVLDFAAAYAGVDLDAARRRMMTPKVRQALACGAQGIIVGAFRYVFANGSIVSVIPAQPSNRTSVKVWGRRMPRRAAARERQELELTAAV